MRQMRIGLLVLAVAGCGAGSTGADGAVDLDGGAVDQAMAAGDLTMSGAPDLSTCPGTKDNCGLPGQCAACPQLPNTVATCVDNKCGSMCAANATTCTGVCTDTMNDNLNCGACGHSCLGGLCSAGRCQANLLGEVAPEAARLVVDDYNAYVTTYDAKVGTVFWLAFTGGAPPIIAQNQAGALGVAVDKSFVYWTDYDGGTISRAPNPSSGGGGNPGVIAMNQAKASDIVVDAANIYWVNAGDGTVMKMPLGGGNPVAIASNQNGPWRMAIDANNVYWTTNSGGTVMQLAKAGGNPVQIAAGQSQPNGVAVDAKNVYWVTTNDGTVKSAPIGGGQVTTLAVGQKNPQGVVADADAVWWTNLDDGVKGSVMSLAHNAQMPVIVANTPNGPTGITISATSVFFTNKLGEVYRIAK